MLSELSSEPNSRSAQDHEKSPALQRSPTASLVVTWLNDTFVQQVMDTSINMQIIDPRDGVVNGSDAGETLYGNDLLNDTLTGFGGDDTLNGGAGADAMSGGLGQRHLRRRQCRRHGRGGGRAAAPTRCRARSPSRWPPSREPDADRRRGDQRHRQRARQHRSPAMRANNIARRRPPAPTRMNGGAGNDTYVVDNAGDIVVESGGRRHRHGAELGQPTRSAADVENLTLTGAAAINGTGNALANIITGNAGNIGGRQRARRRRRRRHDDRRRSATTPMSSTMPATSSIEAAGGGTDTVQSSRQPTRSAPNVENLTLTGAGAINGTGNALANMLTGNAGDNTLDGGAAAPTR